MGYAVLAGRWLTGLVFFVAALSKVRGFDGFRRSVAALAPPLATWSAGVAGLVAAAELLVVALIALPGTAAGGLAAALALDAGFIVVTVSALRRGVQEPCRCFGAAQQALGPRDVVRDAVLGVVTAPALVGAAAGTPARSPAGWLVAAVAGAVGALLVVRFDDLAELFFPGGPARTDPTVRHV
jgi:hypothetical protein